jgi:hypothetical protein
METLEEFAALVGAAIVAYVLAIVFLWCML